MIYHSCDTTVIVCYNWQLQHMSVHIDGLAHDCSDSTATTLELMQSCAEPSIFVIMTKLLLPAPNTDSLVFSRHRHQCGDLALHSEHIQQWRQKNVATYTYTLNIIKYIDIDLNPNIISIYDELRHIKSVKFCTICTYQTILDLSIKRVITKQIYSLLYKTRNVPVENWTQSKLW